MSIHKGQLTIFRCAFCGVAMLDGRKDKKTCSPKCRKRLSRWKKRLIWLEAQAMQNLQELEAYLTFYDARENAARAIKNVEIKAKRVLVENRVQEVG